MFSVHVKATFMEKHQSDDAYKTTALLLSLPQFRSATYKTSGISEVNDKVGEHPALVDETWHDEDTLFKVKDALVKGLKSMEGVEADRINFAITLIQEMQNAGILFRERVPE